MATDFLGQTLNIGDDVIFLNYNRTSADLERGKITKIFPHAAEIGMKRRAEYKIVKILTDVASVAHGRWAHLGGDEWCCPVCGFVITTEGSWDKPTKKYCEDCGAKMDGGGDADADAEKALEERRV